MSTTVTRWAVIGRSYGDDRAVDWHPYTAADEAHRKRQELDGLSQQFGMTEHPHRVVRLDIVLSDEDTEDQP